MGLCSMPCILMADSCFCSAEINTTLWSNYPPNKKKLKNKSILVCSVTKSCPTLYNTMNCSMPGLPVHHQLPESTQTHIHWVGDAMQPSHPLSSPSPPALHLSQHQGLFKWVSSSHQVAKVSEFQLQHQSFQWTPRTDLLQNGQESRQIGSGQTRDGKSECWHSRNQRTKMYWNGWI